MDFDSDYYSPRCKNINGVRVFKRTFMTFVGGNSDKIKRYSILK
jgi:hypothetical protein